MLSTLITWVDLIHPLHIVLPGMSQRTIFVLFLCSLIVNVFIVFEAIYRYHRKTVRDYEAAIQDLTKRHQSEIAEWRRLAPKIENLNCSIGAGDLLFSCLEDGYPIPIKALELWRARAARMVADNFERESARNLQSQPRLDESATLDMKIEWIQDYLSKLQAIHKQKLENKPNAVAVSQSPIAL